jgi:hypothetical protein
MTEPPPPDGRVLGWLSGLTLNNVLVMALLALVAVPVYVVYKALGDDALLDRLMSTYEVIDTKQGCLVRHVQERGGPALWGVSSGFAFQGEARYYVNVIVETLPTDDEVAAYCAVLKLIADRLVERDGEVQRGPLPGTAPDGGGYDGDMPATEEAR